MKLLKEGKIITNNISTPKLLGKMRGLMFAKKLEDEIILFENKRESRLKSALHSLFVFQRFDAIWINERDEVVDLREQIQPFVINITPKESAKRIIEAPNGFIKKNKIEVGDILELKK